MNEAVPLLDGAPPRVGETEYGLSHASDIDEPASESKSHRRLDRGTFCDFGLEYFRQKRMKHEIETTRRVGWSFARGWS